MDTEYRIKQIGSLPSKAVRLLSGMIRSSTGWLLLCFCFSGCASRNSQLLSPILGPGAPSSFHINLYCFQEENSDRDELSRLGLVELEITDEVWSSGTVSDEEPGTDEGVDMGDGDAECISLLETMRDGSEGLHSEAKFERAQNR